MNRPPTALPALATLAWLAPAAAQGLQPPPVPAGNPLTPAKAALGKTLFWDEQLSSTRTLACGTCHRPAAGGSDPRSLGYESVHPGPDLDFGSEDDVVGSPSMVRKLGSGHFVAETAWGFGADVQVTHRKAPSVVMAPWAPELLWDGTRGGELRDPLTDEVVLQDGAALENQVLVPLLAAFEMAHNERDWSDVTARVAASTPLDLATEVPAALDAWIADRDYPALFADAFGDPAITPVRIAMAVASYERTLVADQTPIDDYLNGDHGALTPEEELGLALFESPATSCAECHPAPLFTNHAFEYTGIRPAGEDRGRFYATEEPLDKGRMRVPSLRNVELRAPYFHTGRFATLEEVVDFYDRGGDFDAPQKSPLLRPLGLTAQEKAALVAFLRRPLTDARLPDELPPFDRPALYGESQHVPRLSGAPLAGSGGLAPRMHAYEPPRIGNPSMAIGVDTALGGAPAALALGLRVKGGTLPAVSAGPEMTLHPIDALSGAGVGGGYGSVVLAVPDDPSLVGQTLLAQWIVRDPGAAFGFATSAVAELTWF